MVMHRTTRLEALEEENDELRERLRQLEKLLVGDDLAELMLLGLTAQQAKALGTLMQRDMARNEQLLHAITRDDADEQPKSDIIKVLLNRIRKQLGALAIEIETIWGVGYRLSPGSKERVRAAVRELKGVAA